MKTDYQIAFSFLENHSDHGQSAGLKVDNTRSRADSKRLECKGCSNYHSRLVKKV